MKGYRKVPVCFFSIPAVFTGVIIDFKNGMSQKNYSGLFNYYFFLAMNGKILDIAEISKIVKRLIADFKK